MIMKYLFGQSKKEPPQQIEPERPDPETVARESLASAADNASRCAVIRGIASRKLAKQLIGEFDDPALLDAIAGDDAIDEGVRAEARKRIRALKEIHESGTAVKALRKLEEIVVETEARGAAENWYESFAWLEEARKKWDIYAVNAKGAEDFNAMFTRFNAACAVFDHKLNEQNQLRTIREVWEQLCQRAEALAANRETEIDEVVRTFDELKAHWETKEPLPPSFANRLNARFDAAEHAIREQAARHAEMLEKRGEVCEEAMKHVETAERLAGEEDIPPSKECSELRKAFELTVRPIKGFDGAYRSRFDAAMKRIDDKVVAVKAARQAELDAKRQSAETLCESMERIAGQEITAQYIRDTQSEVEALITQFHALELPAKDPASQRFYKAERHYLNERRTIFATEDQERWANYAVKIKLCEKAEAIAASISDETDVREMSDSLKGLRHDWKAMGPVPKQVNEEIWARFDGACQKIYDWLKVRFEAEDAQRAENLEKKRAICDNLEALVNDTESTMKVRQEKFNAIIASWKEIGQVPREELKPLSERFKAGLDAFSSARKAHYDTMDARFKTSRDTKEKLIEEAMTIAEMPWREGFAKVKELREQWREAGFSGKKDDALWEAFNGAIDAFFNAQSGQHDENLVKKNEVCATLERVTAECTAESSLKQSDDQVRQAIAVWKETGPVPEADTDAILARFKNALDAWHAKRDEIFSALNARREENQRRKEELIAQAEDVMQSEIPQQEKAEKIKALQAEWKSVGATFREADIALRDQFDALCGDFFADRRQQFDQLMTQRKDNLLKKREICVRLEQLSNLSTADESEVVDDMNLLAKELQYILSSNITADRPETREERIDQAIELQARWREIGPVPREESDAIYARYRKACDAIFGPRKPRPKPEKKSEVVEPKSESLAATETVVDPVSESNPAE